MKYLVRLSQVAVESCGPVVGIHSVHSADPRFIPGYKNGYLERGSWFPSDLPSNSGTVSQISRDSLVPYQFETIIQKSS
jgi:hypothetical protein